MDFATAMPALEAWVKAGTGLSQCVWESDRQPFKSKAYGLLSMTASETDGHDELTFQEFGAEDPRQVAPNIAGQRVSTFTVSVMSFVHEPEKWAPYYAEALRTRVMLPSQMALLNDAGLALVDVGALSVRTFEADDYQVNQASFSLRVRSAICIEPVAEHEVDVIETVEVSTTLQGADEVQLPASLQLDEEEIP